MTDGANRETWEAEWAKFQETWEPTDDLAKQAKQDDKRYEKAMSLLAAVSHGLDGQIVAIQARTQELHEVQKQIQFSETRVMDAAVRMEGSQQRAEIWWDEKMDEMRKLMMMMVSMGFEFDSSYEQTDG